MLDKVFVIYVVFFKFLIEEFKAVVFDDEDGAGVIG